jgi:AraC-like DNA-binding protein
VPEPRGILLEGADELAIPQLQPAVVKHVHDLVALALGASRDGAVAANLGGGRAARLREIKADIEQAIGREEISIDRLSVRHRLQVRCIQRLFEAEGSTLTEYVTDRRLAKAYAMLTDGRNEGLPISSVAFEVGFTDHPYPTAASVAATARRPRMFVPASGWKAPGALTDPAAGWYPVGPLEPAVVTMIDHVRLTRSRSVLTSPKVFFRGRS